MKLSVLLFSLVFAANSFGADITLQKVKVIGPMKNKVIFQSTNIKKVKRSNLLKGTIIAQWGTEVFEVLDGYYSCNTKNVCKLVEHERVATYSLCVVKKTKAVCSNKISGSDEINSSSDVVIAANPDEVSDLLTNDRNDEYTEFPVRIEDEYSDIF